MANLPTREAPIFTTGLLPASEPWLRAFMQGAKPALVKVGITASQVVAQAAGALLELLDERKLTKQQLGVELSNRVSQHLAAQQLDAWRSPSLYAPNQSLGEAIIRFILPVLAFHGLGYLSERQGDRAYLVRTDQWL